MADLDELLSKLESLESDNMRLYQESKSLFGWPLCGERPPTPDYFTDEEFEEDATRTVEIFTTFVIDLNTRIKRANTTVKKRFSKYEGEKKVESKDVTVGKPYGSNIPSKRELDL